MRDSDAFKIANREALLAALAALAPLTPADIKAMVIEALREELPRLLAQPAANDPPSLLSPREAAQRLGVGQSTVRKLAARCELPSVRIGRRLLFRPADLDAYAEARRRSPEKVKALG